MVTLASPVVNGTQSGRAGLAPSEPSGVTRCWVRGRRFMFRCGVRPWRDVAHALGETCCTAKGSALAVGLWGLAAGDSSKSQIS